MIHHVFSVFDTKAGSFYPPFMSFNHQVAARSVGDLVNDKAHLFGKHPEDMQLWYLGTFDDSSAKFELVVPEVVCLAIELIHKE